MATVHVSAPGERPRTRRSPPRLTHTPAAPPSITSPTTRSAASPLPIPPGSNPTPRGSLTVASRTTMSVHPFLSALDADRMLGTQAFERPVVAGADHVAEHRGIEAATREAPRLDRPRHEQHGVGTDGNVVAGAPVQRADLARRDEAAPPLFERCDARSRAGKQTGIRTDDDDVDVTAHRAKSRFVHLAHRLPIVAVPFILLVTPAHGKAPALPSSRSHLEEDRGWTRCLSLLRTSSRDWFGRVRSPVESCSTPSSTASNA